MRSQKCSVIKSCGINWTSARSRRSTLLYKPLRLSTPPPLSRQGMQRATLRRSSTTLDGAGHDQPRTIAILLPIIRIIITSTKMAAKLSHGCVQDRVSIMKESCQVFAKMFAPNAIVLPFVCRH